MNKFQTLKGNWIVKKRVTKNISAKGHCVIKSSTKYSFDFKEDIKTNIDNKLISGCQIFQIFVTKNNINFYLNTGNNKKENVYNFKKKKLYQSLYFCLKDRLDSTIIICKNI